MASLTETKRHIWARTIQPEKSDGRWIGGVIYYAAVHSGRDLRLRALTDDMLRDRIVVGIRDQTLSQRLQTDPSLTFEKAKRAVRQKEAVHEQSNILQGDGTANASLL